MNTPVAFIEQQIKNLTQLIDVLAEELNERTSHTDIFRTDARLCRESMMTINVLVPKLEATRAALLNTEPPERWQVCENCDD